MFHTTGFAVLLSFQLIFLQVNAFICPNGWVRYKTSCYFFSETKDHWGVAEEYCHIFGGHLVELETHAESQFVIHEARRLQASSVGYWIGASDMYVEGEWTWLNSGRRVTPWDWAPGEPNNNPEHGGADCAWLYGKDNYLWDDSRCSYAKNFICEQ